MPFPAGLSLLRESRHGADGPRWLGSIPPSRFLRPSEHDSHVSKGLRVAPKLQGDRFPAAGRARIGWVDASGIAEQPERRQNEKNENGMESVDSSLLKAWRCRISGHRVSPGRTSRICHLRGDSSSHTTVSPPFKGNSLLSSLGTLSRVLTPSGTLVPITTSRQQSILLARALSPDKLWCREARGARRFRRRWLGVLLHSRGPLGRKARGIGISSPGESPRRVDTPTSRELRSLRARVRLALRPDKHTVKKTCNMIGARGQPRLLRRWEHIAANNASTTGLELGGRSNMSRVISPARV